MRRLLLSLALALLVGCTTLPATPQQSLAVADAQFTALTRTATDLVLSGTLHGDDAQHVQQLVHQGSAALDTAWKLEGAGQSYADPLSAVIAVDSALQKILQQYQVKP